MAVHSSYRPREQRRAAGILAALVLGAVLLWAVAMATTGSQTVEPEVFGSAELSGTAPSDVGTDAGEASAGSGGAAAGDETGGGDASVGQQEGGDGPGAADEGDDAESTDAADERDDAEATDADAADGEETDPADGEDADPADGDDPSRPIEVEGSQAAWVAIVSSLSGDEFSESAARGRLAPGQQLLWSSDYPSLNPGLWVIVEGPFDREAEARSAARRLGSGAYPRVLTEDEGDRYCALARGCSG